MGSQPALTHIQTQKGTILTCQREFMFTATGQLSKAASASCSFSVWVPVCVFVRKWQQMLYCLASWYFFPPFFFFGPLLPQSFGTHTKTNREPRMQMIHKYQHFCCPAIENALAKSGQQFIALSRSARESPLTSTRLVLCVLMVIVLKTWSILRSAQVPLARDLKCWRAVHK